MALDKTPQPARRIPVILLTGFLGAGKTTLLLRWLAESPSTGYRLGVVMNEFGIESVDSQLLNRPGLPLRQVTGGCLCCADDGELPRAIQRLIGDEGCDVLIVETSGLADPDNIIDSLTDIDLLPMIFLQAVVTVVDAEWYAQPSSEGGERLLARRQIQFAHVLCLSKCDRISEVQIGEVSVLMSALNPKATLYRLPFGLPDLGGLLGREPASVEMDLSSPDRPHELPREGAEHLHTSYQSLLWRFPRPVNRSRFEAFLSMLNPREVVRAKGFVRFEASPEKTFVFQSVFGHHFIEEFLARPHPEPVVVLIGPGLDLEKFRNQLRTLVWGDRLIPSQIIGLKS